MPSQTPPAFKGPRHHNGGGFSLVEVTIALGVVAVAGITMLGLLSVGLTSFQRAEQVTTSGAIRDQIANNLQQAGWAGDMQEFFGVNTTTSSGNTSWVNNGAATTQTEYFDDDANLLTSTSGAIFQATITPLKAASPEYSGNWTGPNQTGAGPAGSPSLMEFQIAISRVGASTTVPGTTTTYIVCVGDN